MEGIVNSAKGTSGEAAAVNAFNSQLEDAGVTAFWHDVDVANTYHYFTSTVSVNHQAEVVRVSNGEIIFSASFFHSDEAKSNEVLIGVRSAVSEIEQAMHRNVRELASGFQPNAAPIAAAGFSRFNAAQAARSVRND